MCRMFRLILFFCCFFFFIRLFFSIKLSVVLIKLFHHNYKKVSVHSPTLLSGAIHHHPREKQPMNFNWIAWANFKNSSAKTSQMTRWEMNSLLVLLRSVDVPCIINMIARAYIYIRRICIGQDWWIKIFAACKCLLWRFSLYLKKKHVTRCIYFCHSPGEMDNRVTGNYLNGNRVALLVYLILLLKGNGCIRPRIVLSIRNRFVLKIVRCRHKQLGITYLFYFISFLCIHYNMKTRTARNPQIRRFPWATAFLVRLHTSKWVVES